MQIAFILLVAALHAEGPQEPIDIHFTAQCDGSTESYAVIEPPGFVAAEAHDVVLALHGHGSDRWQFIRDPRDECRTVRDFAAAHNMIMASPDYRAKTSWMGPKAEADLVQIIADLKQKYRVAKTYLCGGSMGASSALTFTALHPDLVDGVAAMNGTANHLEYENFQDAIQASFGGTKAEIPIEYKNRSAEYWPERFTMPVAVTVGGKDTSVPPDSVRRLARVLEKMGRRVLIIDRPDGGHSTTYEDGRAILEFMIQPLPAK